MVACALVSITSPLPGANGERPVRIPIQGEWIGYDTASGGLLYGLLVRPDGEVIWALAAKRFATLIWRLEVTHVSEKGAPGPRSFEFVLVPLQAGVSGGKGRAEVKVCRFDFVLEVELAVQENVKDSSRQVEINRRILLRARSDLESLYGDMTNELHSVRERTPRAKLQGFDSTN